MKEPGAVPVHRLSAAERAPWPGVPVLIWSVVVIIGMSTLAMVADAGGSEGEFVASVGCALAALLLLTAWSLDRVATARTRQWLDGTTVVSRTMFTTRRIDLAGADVTRDTMILLKGAYGRPAVMVPAVLVRDRGSGATIWIPLHRQRRLWLPPSDLRAIADAVAAGKPGDETVDALVRELRYRADHPLAA